MHVLIIGASGFIATKVAKKLVENSDDERLTLADLTKPDVSSIHNDNNNDNTTTLLNAISVDITSYENVKNMLFAKNQQQYDVIFHLAAIVSGDAEENFEKGYAVNLDGTRNILECIRRHSYNKPPRFIFTSSLAVYGTPLPDIISDEYHLTPRSSYGTQKAMAELLVMDYTRKGYVDGIVVRFPTIAVRPGAPNKAASSFVSGIIREPLNNKHSILPVNAETFRHPIASPQKAVEYLLQAAVMNVRNMRDRVFNAPSITVTPKSMMDALERVAGKETVALIRYEPDEFIQSIVESWPQEFDNKKALSLGFTPDKSVEDIIRAYMKDELGRDDV